MLNIFKLINLYFNTTKVHFNLFNKKKYIQWNKYVVFTIG